MSAAPLGNRDSETKIGEHSYDTQVSATVMRRCTETMARERRRGAPGVRRYPGAAPRTHAFAH